ncbi:MAG: hypothetical protein RLZZ385_1210 [Pseudomonadota bacterium]|jgi:signal transduction histidine kinase/CheY-like chemotaxis protein
MDIDTTAMPIKTHLRRLWNGGLDPVGADPLALRKRRTIAGTALALIPFGLLLMVSNLYTGTPQDNPPIAIALLLVIACTYLQAYFNLQEAAANLGIAGFWVVVLVAMSDIGLWGKAWTWLLPIAPIATLVSGRFAGVIWSVVCTATLWTIAWLQVSGHPFPLAREMPGDSPIYVAIEGTMILGMLAAATFVFRMVQDFTEQRLSATVKQLEAEVQQRTLAETEARQSEIAKSAFLAAMSHELRTPLTGVIGASQLLLQSNLPASKKELVDVIVQSSETLMELSNNVLDLAALDSGKMVLEHVAMDLRQLLNNLLKPLEFQARNKGISLTQSVHEDVPHLVTGDPMRLRQVLLNLIGNAIKFTENGGITVSVDLAFDKLRIKVTDTGIGIPSNALATLFEPYVQAQADTPRRFGGSGLGLAIAKKLVTTMGGKIMVQSEQMEGSTFTLFLPCVKASGVATRTAPPKTLNQPPLRVLIADDNAVNRMVLSRLLEQDDHTVVVVTNGREALDYLADHDVDLVLMDLQMPTLDGMSAVRRLRTLEGQKSDTPVIAITANVNREDSRMLVHAGMNGVLTKPFRYEDLKQVIGNVMAGRRRLSA